MHYNAWGRDVMQVPFWERSFSGIGPLLEPDLEGELTGEHLVDGPLAIDLSQAQFESTTWDRN